MASITKKSTSKKWIACFTDAAGKQRQRSTAIEDTGTPAERSAAQRQARQVAHEFEAAARGDRTEAQIRKTLTELYNVVNPAKRLEWTTVRPFFTSWLERIATRKTGGTYTRYASVVKRFLDGLGAKADGQLGDVTTEDIQQALDSGIKKGKRAGTLRLELKILNAAFAYALRMGLIIMNPVSAAETPDAAGESKRPFTTNNVRALIAACKSDQWPPGDRVQPRLTDWETTIRLGAQGGLRLGDACNLRWSNIDFSGKVITLKPEKTKRKENKEIKIPMHPSLEAHLLTIKSADDPKAFLTPTLAGDRIGGRSGLSRQFQRIMEVASIENEALSEASNGGRGFNAFGFHSLRHYYVTTLADVGVAQDMRMALAGHASSKVNELYTHRGLESLAAAVAKLPGF